MVSNEQLYLAIGIPVLMYLGTTGLLMAYINAKFSAVDQRFQSVEERFKAQDAKLDALRDTWRSELRRVEEVLDARLKHLEER